MAIVVATSSASAQDRKFGRLTSNHNLSMYGVPDVNGIIPYKTKHVDLSDRMPGKETKVEFYKVGNGMVLIFSVDNKAYHVGWDRDSKPPFDYAFTDKEGRGKFVKYNPNKKVPVPNWVLK